MEKQEYLEFKTLLEDLKVQLAGSILQLKSEMSLISDVGEVDDSVDIASLMTDSMDHSALINQQIDELADVEHALAKFELGSYGICEKTGEEIPKERLRVEPQARCIVEKE